MHTLSLTRGIVALAVLASVSIAYVAHGATPRSLTVGPSGTYHTIQDAVNAAANGDTILISAGTYTDQSITIAKNISLVGVNGRPLLTQSKTIANGKAFLVTQGNITISNLEFANASVPDHNGAGIRFEGGTLVVQSSVFRDNQEGILGGAYPNGEVTITGSTFLRNGYGDGYSHGIYIGAIRKLTVSNSTFQETKVGHHIKSRASESNILNNVITDDTAGTASYDIDLPNGGNATIMGNTITKGPAAQNTTFISYGEEGSAPTSAVCTITSNYLTSMMSKNTIGIKNASTATINAKDNTFKNIAAWSQGPVNLSNNNANGSSPIVVTTPIILTVSADSYLANPEIEVLADGQTLTGRVVVTSQYPSNAWQTITLTASGTASTLEIGLKNGLITSKGIRTIHLKSVMVAGKLVPLTSAQYKVPSTIPLDSDGTLGSIGSYRIYFPSIR